MKIEGVFLEGVVPRAGRESMWTKKQEICAWAISVCVHVLQLAHYFQITLVFSVTRLCGDHSVTV